MAQIVLSQAGAAIGRRLLPKGLALLGRTLSGAAIGRAAGSAIGQAIDSYFAAPAEGPRIRALPVMGADEGEGIASVFGRMRTGGQLIWASRFREDRSTARAGGKGGPRLTQYRYSISLAVAVGEGPVQRIVRAWANGEPFDLSSVTCRFHPGTEDQEPDPLIEMIEGIAPAYRGIAYIVFEDLPLNAFGNRIPQFAFEVIRTPDGSGAPRVADVVSGINIIPASGEFVYATSIVRDVLRPGVERPINAHSAESRPDFLVSLDQLAADLPAVTHVALTCGWFASGTAAGSAAIRPGVETRTRITRPQTWAVAGRTRADAYLVSQDESGRPNYGGTPSDSTVVEALRELKTRGYAVTLTPFLFVDAPGFAWRGRITVSADRSAAARAEIDAFVNGPQGYRAFILHHAALAAEAGGVEAFLIGSEMRGLTRIRDAAGAFPFVEALCTLAADVKAILPDARISYAADWTEYGAYVPGDGSGDVLFPLDALWAHSAIAFVGIDWYPPMGDWREGTAHLDAQAGFTAPDDPGYLAAQVAGGEAFEWYYADTAARNAQLRTPITDTAHGEHWVFRAKDITGWWSAAHHPRPDGVRAALPTAWMPGSKPVRLCEIGFAAVDKAGNAPNLFFDPKSDESGLPPFSTGARDDLMQSALLAASLPQLMRQPAVEAALVWAWDARPFPAWPLRTDIWGDGSNWARGHWLNGRAGLAPLAAVIDSICSTGGVSNADTSQLVGLVDGYLLDGVSSVRAALEPLRLAYGFEAIERDGVLTFRMAGGSAAIDLDPAAFDLASLQEMRQLMDKAPERLRLMVVDPDRDHVPMIVEARRGTGDARLVTDMVLPLALPAGRAEQLAATLLTEAAGQAGATVDAGPGLLALEAGDRVRLADGAVWTIASITDASVSRQLSLVPFVPGLAAVRAATPGPAPAPPPVYPDPDLVVIDAPAIAVEDGTGPMVAAYADPWPGSVVVRAGPAPDALTERVAIAAPARIARLLVRADAAPAGRWDRRTVLRVALPDAGFESLSAAAVLAGGNLALLETAAGWEAVQFQHAELVAPDTWRLTGLLRGQAGSTPSDASEGARLVMLDAAVVRAAVSPLEIGTDLVWSGGDSNPVVAVRFMDLSSRPWTPCHLRVRKGIARWRRRGADVPDSWTFPDAPNAGRFVIEFDSGSGFASRIESSTPECTVPQGTRSLRVAECGADGRISGWLSIGPGSPYL